MMLSYDAARDFLYREARYLDDKGLGRVARTLCAGRHLLDAGLG